jgi:hypothetical protein
MDIVEAAAIIGGGWLSGNIFERLTGFFSEYLGLEADDELKAAGVITAILAAYLAETYLGGRTGELLSKFFLGVGAGIAGDDPPVVAEEFGGYWGVIG